jgi:hypothetical protein
VIWLLSLLLIAAGGFAAWPALRRRAAVLGIERMGASPEVAGSEAPRDLPAMPEPPVLQRASVQWLDCTEVRGRLRALELGLDVAAIRRSSAVCSRSPTAPSIVSPHSRSRASKERSWCSATRVCAR